MSSILFQRTWLRNKRNKAGEKKGKSDNRSDKYVALQAFPDRETNRVRFELVKAAEQDELGFDPEAGSKAGNAVCVFCGATASVDYIKEQGQKGNLSRDLMAVVCTQRSGQGKVYLADCDISSIWEMKMHLVLLLTIYVKNLI